jgi:hypothetical protein
MKKLFKLKKWHTINEAAENLSELLGETVGPADIYRLCLDGHLTISVNFVNHAYARKGSVGGPESARWAEIPDDEFFRNLRTKLSAQGKLEKLLLSLRYGEDTYLNFDHKISSIEDVWDLMMIGSERLDIEHNFQMLTGGPEVTLTNMEGVFVRQGDVICNLVESFDNNPYQKGSKAWGEDVEKHIRTNKLSKEEAKTVRDQYKEDRKSYLKKQSEAPHEDGYYPAGGIPKDAVLVVRTEAILAFLQSINDEPSKAPKPLTTKERNTLLVLLAALCKQANIDFNKPGIATAIARMTENIGAPITDDTIRNIIKQMNEALETRSK